MELFESLMLGCLVAELLGGIGKTHWLLVLVIIPGGNCAFKLRLLVGARATRLLTVLHGTGFQNRHLCR